MTEEQFIQLSQRLIKLNQHVVSSFAPVVQALAEAATKANAAVDAYVAEVRAIKVHAILGRSATPDPATAEEEMLRGFHGETRKGGTA